MTDPTVRAEQWRHLQSAFQYVTLAESAFSRGDHEAGAICIGDTRAALGALALLLSDEPDARGYALLLAATLTDPNVVRRG